LDVVSVLEVPVDDATAFVDFLLYPAVTVLGKAIVVVKRGEKKIR
jgi:hypothetical protein